MMWIAGFYAFFHLWLNIIGEVLCFGDRSFYRDWWNCRSLEEYWKTWNLPVHFWFIRHVYNPLLQLGVSKIVANLVVFFVSALAHEYIVSVPLGFISYWAFLAIMMQAPFILIQRKLDKILRIEHS
jgi:diacylglycerol O-acyltransferase-1